MSRAAFRSSKPSGSSVSNWMGFGGSAVGAGMGSGVCVHAADGVKSNSDSEIALKLVSYNAVFTDGSLA